MEAQFALNAHTASPDAELDVVELPLPVGLEIDAVDLDRAAYELALASGAATAAAPLSQTALSIDLVVVTHDSRGDLERCFASVLAASRAAGAGVIVVDNGSTDGTVEWLRAQRGVAVVSLSEDLGYAAAVNVGAACSDADHLVVLKADVTVPSPEAIHRLAEHLEVHPDAAVAAPRLLDTDGATQASARVVPTLGMLVADQTRLGRTPWGRRRAERYLAVPAGDIGHAETEWALGAAMAIRRSDFDTVGGWDERLSPAFEDVDFCVRLRHAGRQVHYLPAVALVHDIAPSRAPVATAAKFFAKHPRYAVRRGVLPRRVDLGAIVTRTLDVVVASTLLVLAAPVLALVALSIRLDSPGPVIFRQRRLGRHKEPFTLFKFRTMTVGSEDDVDVERVKLHIEGRAVSSCDGAPIYKCLPAHRITRVGARLRHWSVDELPQLWNVLRGEMTLVGFRPPTPIEVDHYPVWYHGRFVLKPGLTGIWQVSGRNKRSYEEMVRMDLEYVERRCWWLDLQLLFRTFGAVLARRGAY
jgi:lipopolysaccharide/colanic/teichoic acid biosynthesis glycosyltransferase